MIEMKRERESVIEIVLLDEDANRKWNCAHLNRHMFCKGEKRFVVASLREKKNNLNVIS
jgi:hypothetical protein